MSTNFEELSGMEVNENLTEKIGDLTVCDLVDVDNLGELGKITDAARLELSTEIFEKVVSTNPALYEQYCSVSDGSLEQFTKAYEQYVNNPEGLKESNPELYSFFCENLFFGMEFLGMEAVIEQRDVSEGEKRAKGPVKIDQCETVDYYAKSEETSEGAEKDIESRLNPKGDVAFYASGCEGFCKKVKDGTSVHGTYYV